MSFELVSAPISISGENEELIAKEEEGILTHLHQGQLSEWRRVISRAPDRNYIVVTNPSCSDQGKPKDKRARKIADAIWEELISRAEDAGQSPNVRAIHLPCNRPRQESQLANAVYLAIETVGSKR